MKQIEFSKGSRKVIATRNCDQSIWSARLYVDYGEVATLEHGRFKTDGGLKKWADKKLNKR